MDCEPEVATQCASLMVEWITETLTDRGWLLIADFGLFEIHNHKEYILHDPDKQNDTLMPPRLELDFTPAPLLDLKEVEERFPTETVSNVFSAISAKLIKQKIDASWAERAPVAFFKTILTEMDNGEPVVVDGLGDFLLTKVRVGECVYGKISFSPSEQLAAKINKPFAYFEPVPLRDGVTFDDIIIVNSGDHQAQDSDDKAFLIAQNPVSDNLPDQDGHKADALTEKAEDIGNSSPDMSLPHEEAPQVDEATHEDGASEVDHLVSSDDLPSATESETKPKWRIWTALAAACVVAVLGWFFLSKDGDKQPVPVDTVSQEINDTAGNAKVVESVKVQTADNQTDDFKAMNAQIPYGAYDIVGIDTVITVMNGQTLADISRIFLGTDIQIYLIVLNEGNNEPKEGDQYKIPKLKLRKK